MKGQKSSISIGNEWFNTNEEEILSLINNIKLLGIELEINLKNKENIINKINGNKV